MITASLRLCLATLLSCCVLYPAAVLFFAVTAAPEGRLGSLILGENGVPIGSRLLAQRFSSERYFWPRPSAVDYNAQAAGGSNLSPGNPDLHLRARGIIAALGTEHTDTVPTDLVLASGSGLDPHISKMSALLQIRRIAAARGLPPDLLRLLIERQSFAPGLAGKSNSEIVNVLDLNVALDSASR